MLWIGILERRWYVVVSICNPYHVYIPSFNKVQDNYVLPIHQPVCVCVPYVNVCVYTLCECVYEFDRVSHMMRCMP